MSSVLNKIVKLRTITPLIIQHTEVIPKYEYFIDEQTKKISIYKGNLLEFLVEKGLNYETIKEILFKDEGIENLDSVLQKLQFNPNLKNEVEKRIVKLNFNGEKKRLIEIKDFIHNEKFYYIPGSSIKGALRSYLTLYELIQDPNKKNELRLLCDSIAFHLKRARVHNDKKIQLRDLLFKSKKLNIRKENFNHLKENKNKINQEIKEIEEKIKNEFCFKKIQISDSNPVELDKFEVNLVYRGKRNKKIEGIPNFVLSLKEDVEVELKIKINEKLLDKLKIAVREVNKNVLEKLKHKEIFDKDTIDKLKKLNENNFLINLGGFSGSLTKTIISLLSNYYPTTFNYVFKDNKKIPLGWVLIEI